MDPGARNFIRGIIAGLAISGKSVIWTSHRLVSFLFYFKNLIFFLSAGFFQIITNFFK